MIIRVEDPLLTQNTGSFRLEAGPDGASVTRTRRRPDLIMNVRELSCHLPRWNVRSRLWGGQAWSSSEPKVRRRSGGPAFGWPQPPFCPDFF